jgi:hypothetical protein
MIIFGKSLSEYVAFTRMFIAAVFLVGLARLALSLAGAPNTTTRWVSMTVVIWIGLLYYSVRVHSSGFGSYRHLLPVIALPNFVGHAIAILAIVIAIFTGNDNVFSAPEYAFGGDGKSWLHAGAHLFVGTTIGTLVPWLIGCVFMLAAKKLTPAKRTNAAVRL